MGIVYAARHEALDRLVALKLLPSLGHVPRVELRFRREARAVARLHHGNIVPVFEVGEVDGAPYYSMQLIEGRTLAELIESERRSQSGSLAERSRVAARRVAQIARALHYAHERGVVHRDVKPSNLLIDGKGVPWLVDFGLAKVDDGDLTAPQDLLGTVRYMPPERFEGRCDERRDVYSLGLTLYEALALRSAYLEREPSRLMRTILEHGVEPPDPPTLAPARPPPQMSFGF